MKSTDAAFPRPGSKVESPVSSHIPSQDGLTVRDYAAIKFIAAKLIANPNYYEATSMCREGLALADEFVLQANVYKEKR